MLRKQVIHYLCLRPRFFLFLGAADDVAAAEAFDAERLTPRAAGIMPEIPTNVSNAAKTCKHSPFHSDHWNTLV